MLLSLQARTASCHMNTRGDKKKDTRSRVRHQEEENRAARDYHSFASLKVQSKSA